MTRHIEPYRYEVQHGDDADFVAYQRKSSDGGWQTISVWMIPQPAGHSVLASRCTVPRYFGGDRVSQPRIPICPIFPLRPVTRDAPFWNGPRPQPAWAGLGGGQRAPLPKM